LAAAATALSNGATDATDAALGVDWVLLLADAGAEDSVALQCVEPALVDA